MIHYLTAISMFNSGSSIPHFFFNSTKTKTSAYGRETLTTQHTVSAVCLSPSAITTTCAQCGDIPTSLHTANAVCSVPPKYFGNVCRIESNCAQHLSSLKLIHVIQVWCNICTLILQVENVLRQFCLFVLRFYGPVNPMGSCRARSVYLTTRLLGRLSPLSG